MNNNNKWMKLKRIEKTNGDRNNNNNMKHSNQKIYSMSGLICRDNNRFLMCGVWWFFVVDASIKRNMCTISTKWMFDWAHVRFFKKNIQQLIVEWLSIKIESAQEYLREFRMCAFWLTRARSIMTLKFKNVNRAQYKVYRYTQSYCSSFRFCVYLLSSPRLSSAQLKHTWWMAVNARTRGNMCARVCFYDLEGKSKFKLLRIAIANV